MDGIGAFLEVAKVQGCDTAPVWNEIVGESGRPNQNAKLTKLAPSAWETPLGKIGSFFNVAKKHGQNVELLYQMFEGEPDRFSQKCLDAPLNEVVGFAHHAPVALFEIALRRVEPGHWDAVSSDEGLAGATWLVWNCNRVNRTDLADDLIRLLLRRANWRDFPPQSGGFAQVCWLLANVPSSANEFVEPFLKAVCAEVWLHIAYIASSCGQLASGLRQLALHQPVGRCRQFHHKGLGGRLNKELARFETIAQNDQSQNNSITWMRWALRLAREPTKSRWD